MSIDRIRPTDTWDRMKSPDHGTLLVCAYADDEKCRKLQLAGAVTLAELEEKDPAADRELVFYCN